MRHLETARGPPFVACQPARYGTRQRRYNIRGAYTLTLWDADGRSVILENVTFP